MSIDPPSLLQRSRLKAQAQIRASVRQRYFPEIWYALENWFQLLKGRRALEVGYGIGLIAEALAKSGWNVTCVDASLAALAELRERFGSQGLAGAFEQADPDKLPFASASYDAVCAINTLEFAVDPTEAVREISRILAPGGRGVIATFNKLSPWGLPAVVRALHVGDELRPARPMMKDEFVRILKVSGLIVENVRDRACYLPVGGALKLSLPIAGAFVALVSKAGGPRPPGSGGLAKKPSILGT